MAQDIEDRITYGFYVPDEQKFFYLETGFSRASASTERLRKILNARGLISTIGRARHSIITMSEAHDKGYEIEPVFTNPHVEAQYMARKEKQSEAGKSWM